MVPAVTQLAPPSIERSTRKPCSFAELSVQVIPTIVLDHYGEAATAVGAAGAVVAMTPLAMLEICEVPPSLSAKT